MGIFRYKFVINTLKSKQSLADKFYCDAKGPGRANMKINTDVFAVNGTKKDPQFSASEE